MTIDPSGLPNFGPQQNPNDDDSGEAPLMKPDNDLVKQLLDQMELSYGTDDEGDLFAPYENFRVFFMFRGDEQELFAVRTYYDRVFDIEEKPRLQDIADEWNRETLWPKVYTHTDEEGQVRLVGEAQMVVVTNVNLDFFVSNTISWLQASIGFDGRLSERLGLIDPEDEEADGEKPAEGTTDDETPPSPPETSA